MKKKNFPGRKNDRRIKAKARLEKMVGAPNMEEENVKRMKKELKILEERIVTPEVARGTRTKKYRGTNN